MKNITLILLIFIVHFNLETKSQDTLILKKNSYLLNSESHIPAEKDVELYNGYVNFDGFLIIKVDDKSCYIKNSTAYEVKMYFVDSLSDFINEINIFYYNQVYAVLVDLFSSLYENGIVNKLTSFLHFYKIFVNANSDSLNVFLYKGNNEIGTNDLYAYKTVYKKSDDLNSYYFIYRLKFDTAILNFKNSFDTHKILMPLSHLKLFRNLYSYEIQNSNFAKANVVLRLE